MKTIAYIYNRISSKRQTSGNGLGRQESNALAYTARCGFEVQDVMQDVGSAFHGDHMHGALGTFLEYIKANPVTSHKRVLIVESLDRLGREHTMSQLARFIDIVQSGVDVHEISTSIVYSYDKSELLHIALAVMSRAHNESAMKSARAKHNAEVRAAQYAQGSLKKYTPLWIDVIDGKYVLNSKSIWIRKIFDMYLSGCGSMLIMNELQKMNADLSGARYENAKPLSLNRILRIIQNPSTYGALVLNVQGTKQIVTDYYPAVISVDEFNRAQHIRSTKSQSTRTIRDNVPVCNSFISSLMKCSLCGSTYEVHKNTWRTSSSVKRRDMVRCSSRNAGSKCASRAVFLDVLEKHVLDTLRVRLSAGSLGSYNDQISNTQRNVLASIARCESQILTLMDLVLSGVSAAKSKLLDVQKELDSLKNTLDTSSADTAVLQLLNSNILDISNVAARTALRAHLVVMRCVVRVCRIDDDVQIKVQLFDQ